MKKALSIFGMIAISTLAVFAGRKFHDPSEAALSCPEVRQYLNDGFTISEVTPNMNRYIVEPTGSYDWGRVTITMSKRTGGFMSLETTYVSIQCNIWHSLQGNASVYSVTNTTVSTNIVY